MERLGSIAGNGKVLLSMLKFATNVLQIPEGGDYEAQNLNIK